MQIFVYILEQIMKAVEFGVTVHDSPQLVHPLQLRTLALDTG